MNTRSSALVATASCNQLPRRSINCSAPPLPSHMSQAWPFAITAAPQPAATIVINRLAAHHMIITWDYVTTGHSMRSSRHPDDIANIADWAHRGGVGTRQPNRAPPPALQVRATRLHPLPTHNPTDPSNPQNPPTATGAATPLPLAPPDGVLSTYPHQRIRRAGATQPAPVTVWVHKRPPEPRTPRTPSPPLPFRIQTTPSFGGAAASPPPQAQPRAPAAAALPPRQAASPRDAAAACCCRCRWSA